MTGHPFDDFGAKISFDGDQTVVGVRGDVDHLTAPTLLGLLSVLLDRGHQVVVLDLVDLAFMDAAGLGVIAAAAGRLETSGGSLTVRSAPPLTRKILDITGMSSLVRIEVSQAKVSGLGREQRCNDHTATVAGRPTDLSTDLAQVHSIRTADNLIDAALRLVTSLASATIDGADGVSVTLERKGQLTTVASSDETVLRMDRHQYETGEGPCLAAAAEGHWFHSESLADENRWPAFRPLALDEGIASILSTPLVAADRPVGALNIYSNTERAFGADQQELAALFATQASGILADAGADVTEQQLGTRIADALLSRETIAQAQGVLMERQNLTADEAASTLHRSARSAEVPVQHRAAEVVASTRRRTGAGQESLL